MAVQSIRQAKVSPEALPRLFEIVERQDRRLAQFVDEFLDLGRIRAGRLWLEYEEVNLGDVLHDVAARLGPELARSGSSLTLTAQGAVVGQWDRSRLDQVVSNLLSNAIKFGLGKPIEITLGTRGDTAVLSVTDHGMGIEPQIREHIFHPFERGVSVRHYGGLGAGASHRADDPEGARRVSDRDQRVRRGLDVRGRAAPAPGRRRGAMNILLVDDDPDIREVLALVLRAEGHQVEEAGDGLQALAWLREGSAPSLILLDLMMPRLDGEGFTRELRGDPRLAWIPICILSGHHAARETALQLGAVGCLVKPIELEQLSAILRSVAGTRT
jgi:CheY-like chemotaxis protein